MIERSNQAGRDRDRRKGVDEQDTWLLLPVVDSAEAVVVRGGTGGRVVAIHPPGVSAGRERDPLDRHRWRIATWRSGSADPDWGAPDSVVAVSVGEVRSQLGEAWGEWLVERTLRHLRRLAASRRNPFSGRLDRERIRTAESAIDALLVEARAAFPHASWEVQSTSLESADQTEPELPLGSLGQESIPWDEAFAHMQQDSSLKQTG